MTIHASEMSRDYRRIEEAIRYLDDRLTTQPSLEAVAAHVGLSKFHFHRLFRRWAGVSPKQFLEYLTVDYAKELLRGNESVLGAAYEAGLSSPARLHDQFVAIEAVTPGEWRARGAGVEIRYGFHATPFGAALLASTARGLCALAFVGEGGRDAALAALASRWPKARLVEDPTATEQPLAAIFGEAGARRHPLQLFLQGTNFQIKVWEALLAVPEGAAVTYGDLAAAVGRPAAVRAVAGAVGSNPVAFLIPCHRVLRRVGGFGGYRWGSERKRAILAWEAAHLSAAGGRVG
jgi:AraC family transcriptional regulator of adaptative response/methylated-DNA-[protein]-cysteine methyltransferase